MRGKMAHEAFDKFMSENPRCNDERSSLHYWDPLFAVKGTVTVKKSGVVTARVELEEAALSEAWIQKDATRLHQEQDQSQNTTFDEFVELIKAQRKDKGASLRERKYVNDAWVDHSKYVLHKICNKFAFNEGVKAGMKGWQAFPEEVGSLDAHYDV